MDCSGPFLVRTLSVTACAVLPAPRSGENLSRRGKASVETGSGMAEGEDAIRRTAKDSPSRERTHGVGRRGITAGGAAQKCEKIRFIP